MDEILRQATNQVPALVVFVVFAVLILAKVLSAFKFFTDRMREITDLCHNHQESMVKLNADSIRRNTEALDENSFQLGKNAEAFRLYSNGKPHI